MATLSCLLRVALVSGLALTGAVGCNDDDASPPTDDDTTSTATVEDAVPTTSTSSATTPRLDWTQVTSVDGLLEQTVAWEGGLAAVHSSRGLPETSDGRLWLSDEGVDWLPAPSLPEEVVVYHVASQDGALFVSTGDYFDDSTAQTLWHSIDGENWTEVLSDPAMEHVAVGPERCIVWAQGPPFQILGVFDTDTLEPAPSEGIADPPDLEPTEQVAALGEQRGTLINRGRITALDDGFLASVGWFESLDPEIIDERVFHSVDGTTWTEHLDPDAQNLRLELAGQVPTVDGTNLVPATDPPARLTDTGLDLEPADVPIPVGLQLDRVSSTDQGVIGEIRGIIHHSPDGREWRTLPAPDDWGDPASFDRTEPGFLSATIVELGTDLVAVATYGTPVPYGYPDSPQTRIWTTPAAGF